MKIGNKEFKHGLILAPMAGFTDRAMRYVAHKFGAEYSVTEMVSAKAVCYGDKKTHALAKIMPDEGDVGLQIFGSEPDIMARAAHILEVGEEGAARPFAIDINFGCPVNKVFSNGEGSALMRDPDRIYKIVKSVSESISIPCTAKIRLGIDGSSVNAVECALACQEGGAALIAVHGRTRVEMYTGEANMEEIKKVKQSLHIPVIANGDIKSGADAAEVLLKTGADGIMIGRGAIGNPFVFEECRAVLSGEKYTPPTVEMRIDTALLQLSLAIDEKGEEYAVKEARKQIALYLHSFRGAAAARAEINRALTYKEVENALRQVLNT